MSWIVGDVHGKLGAFKAIVNKLDSKVYQLGDLGIGFFNPKTGIYSDIEVDPNKVFLLRGNHDRPDFFYSNTAYLGDYGYLVEGSNKRYYSYDLATKDKKKLFFVSGELSIDRLDRIKGETWWENEQLTDEQMHECYTLYQQSKPEIVLSHGCPSSLIHLVTDNTKKFYSKTAELLDRMFAIWRPQQFWFGHHHCSRSFNILGCKFTCLNELEYKKLPDWED